MHVGDAELLAHLVAFLGLDDPEEAADAEAAPCEALEGKVLVEDYSKGGVVGLTGRTCSLTGL